jgi:hypothetical protein
MALPFLLAGPVVRRVEPSLVSVWVVTSTPCTVGLHVWPGEVSAGTGTGGVFDPGGEAARGSRPTLRIGAQFHVAVVIADVLGNQPLVPGTRYSYNVTFDGLPARRDLHELGLLRDRPQQPALGYQPGTLPSFATCPLGIDDLVLLHGSCNRIDAAGGPNLMFAIDELIKNDLASPAHRPHQLWLSGDQVYSDEIAAAISPPITKLGRDLVGADEYVELVDESTTPLLPINQDNFPAGYRHDLMRDQAKLTSSEAASHLLGMTERLAAQLMMWSPEVWPRNTAGEVELSQPKDVLTSKAPPLEHAPLGLFAGTGDAAAVKKLLGETLNTFSAQQFAQELRKAQDEFELVFAYAAKVGVIRRALANVATYMVFDDHDVTDDWNLCQLWKDRVYGTRLGRSVIRDGLTVFALTQGWGNDPRAYDTGPGAEVLAAAAQLFPEGAAAPLPDPNAVDALDRLFGLGGQPPTMRWHYTIDGAAHRVIACDTRTRRGFTSPTSPPVQLPDGERELQIPAGPLPAGLEVLVVVLSQPLLDPVLLGELTQGLISRGAAAFGSIDDKMLNRVDSKSLAGLETLDYEGWGARPAEIPRLLEHLATYARVVIMSGDVHFSVSLGLRFWRGTQGLVCTIGQFTSSAVQYITFPEALLPILGQGWAAQLAGALSPSEYLVWNDPPELPVIAPGLAKRDLRRRLLHRPVIVPTTGWPQATETHLPPDFAYRVDLLDDDRPDDENAPDHRPEPVRADALDAEFDAQDPLHGRNGYAALARRHSAAVHKHANIRRIGIYNKIARISFRHAEHTEAPMSRLVVRSELMSIDHYSETPDPPAPFTVHELEFDQPNDALAPRIR